MDIKQKLILRKLVSINGQKYSELFKFFTYEDKFPYHLKFLLTKGFVNKRGGAYFITKEGMKVTANFDSRNFEEAKQLFPMFLFVCQFEDKFLIAEHFSDDKNPKRKISFLHFAKPIWGKMLEESAKSELVRKYRFEPELSFRSTFHQIHKTTDGDVLFDDIWLVYDAKFKDKPTLMNKDGWLTKKEIENLNNIHPFIRTLILENNRNSFIENEITLNYGIEEEDL